MSNGNGKAKTLGVFALAMINVAAVLILRNYPSMAVYGWSSIGWYVIGTIAFFIPLTLAGAELATGWPKGGGVYAWVKEAFGEASGFIAVFCEGRTTRCGFPPCWPLWLRPSPMRLTRTWRAITFSCLW
jgi:glutamate:GABA antiporter